jgi:hypothetical protein
MINAKKQRPTPPRSENRDVAINESLRNARAFDALREALSPRLFF